MSWATFKRTYCIISTGGGDIKIEPSYQPDTLAVTVGKHMVVVDTEDLLGAIAEVAEDAKTAADDTADTNPTTPRINDETIKMQPVNERT